jgi:nucleotide-sensitive chloride channel 1A
LNQIDLSLGIAADFTSISMHAIATDRETVERPCLYVQIDADYSDDEEPDLQDDEDGAFHNLQRELTLVPEDSAKLDSIWTAFCDGAERNPDPQAAEEGQGSLFFNQDEALAGAFDQALPGGDEDDEADEEDPDRFADTDEEQETHQNGV